MSVVKSNENDVTSVCPKNVGRIQSPARSFTSPTNGAYDAGEPLLPSFAVTSDVTPKSTSGKVNRCFVASLFPLFVFPLIVFAESALLLVSDQPAGGPTGGGPAVSPTVTSTTSPSNRASPSTHLVTPSSCRPYISYVSPYPLGRASLSLRHPQ